MQRFVSICVLVLFGTLGSRALAQTTPASGGSDVPGALPAASDKPAPRVVHLEDAVRMAREHHPSVLQAKGLTEAASGRIQEARSGYLPQVTGTALAERVHGVVSAPTGSGTGGTGAPGSTTTVSVSSTRDLFSVGLNATQLIWDFGTTINRTKAASVSRDASEANEHTAELQVSLQVRRAFFQAHAQRALMRVGEETVSNQERHLAQITGFVEQGTRPEIDLAQARTDLANSKVTLINARSAYEIAKAQLNQAMGVVGPTDYDVGDEDIGSIQGEDGSPDALVGPALSARPELVNLKKQKRAAELTLSAIRGAYGPTFSALGGVSEAGVALDQLGTNWNVGLLLAWPLFQGGLTHGQAVEAQGNLDAASAQMQTEELQVRLDVQQALLDVQSTKVVILAAREALVNAKEQLRLAEGRYESGVGSIIELGDAQVAEANAAAQDVQADYNLASARAELLSALGR